jgi:predicted MFS family arabinose efflux permease
VGAAAVLAALHFREPHSAWLAGLGETERREALDYCDRAGLTLLVRGVLPEETASAAEKNLARLRVVEETYRRLAKLPGEFLALKGITQCELFGIRPEDRAQYDIDLYFPRDTVEAARDLLLAWNYESIPGMEGFPTDHLPGLFPRTGWRWRDDYFDAEMPLAIELHFQFWNPQLERLAAPGVEEFWTRRVRRLVGGVSMAVLCPQDAVAYAALHLLKHVLHGSTRPLHVYEMAGFLERHAGGGAFWDEWRQLHSPELRRLQAVTFLLAEAWFGCALAPAAREETERLPASTLAWFEEFSTSPAVQPFRPNKDELWLHLSLLDSPGDAMRVARRRLLPGNLPPPARPTESASGREVYLAWFMARLRHHALSLGTTVTSGARWWWRINGLGEAFWTFLAAGVLFNLALFIFFLLYNLYLVDLGFGMSFVGTINAAARAGSLAGTLPAAWLAHRLGLRRALLFAIGATAALTAARAMVIAELPLTALAFASGAIFAVWAVVMAPSIAAAVAEKRRPAAFSLFFAVMFATGIAGNWIGGLLPDLVQGTRNALLAAAALAAAALAPAMKLRVAADPAPAARGSLLAIYPRSRFLARFLVPFALWHLATGSFNPFGNVYFAHLKFPVEAIGKIFSAGQVVQVVAVLLAPLVIRRLGLTSGIAHMMAAAALGMAALAAQMPGAAAVMAYAGYMAFQWMSEPGLNTLLMNHVNPRERAGASSLNYLVAFGAQALAAFAAGQMLERSGYGIVLGGAALLAALSAAGFRILPGGGE